jgi:restriction endonuclease S subunit
LNSQEALNLHRLAKIGGQPSISQASILEQCITLPSFDEQNQIVETIQEEEKAIEECKKLIKLHQEKINTKIKSIWGDSCE